MEIYEFSQRYAQRFHDCFTNPFKIHLFDKGYSRYTFNRGFKKKIHHFDSNPTHNPIYAKGNEIKGWSHGHFVLEVILFISPAGGSISLSPKSRFSEYCTLQSQLYGNGGYKSGCEINPCASLWYSFRWRERKTLRLFGCEWARCDSSVREE
jgi:hypothetical protein